MTEFVAGEVCRLRPEYMEPDTDALGLRIMEYINRPPMSAVECRIPDGRLQRFAEDLLTMPADETERLLLEESALPFDWVAP